MNAYAVREALKRNPKGRPRDQALRWWRRHQMTLVELTDNELRALSQTAAKGNHTWAEIELIAGAPRRVWLAYRNRVTRTIALLANRRARAAYAIRKLSVIALRMLGTAIARGLP